MKLSRVLVIKLRAIGDVVLVTSVFPNIKKTMPDTVVDVLVEEPAAPVLQGNPFVDNVIILPRKKWEKINTISAWFESLKFIRKLRRNNYDAVIDLFGNPRSAFLTMVSGAKQRVGFKFRGRSLAYNLKVEPRGDRVHEVEFNLDALRAMGIPVESKEPQITVSEKEYRKIDEWIADSGLSDKKIAGIHSWASWQAKEWAAEKFIELSDRIVNELGMEVVLVWGPGEKDRAERIQKSALSKLYLAPATNLKELAALMSRFDAVVATDSGPMHIAAAMGTPTLGIYGPTNWKLQGPFGPQNRAVYLKGLECLGCNLTECSKRTCMKDLSVEMVFNELKDMMNKI
ncbi:lipopolysaccharide heptosyltransferase II [bacterium]|nr:lipopolysaccharide heptosyltransferase II [bacterium]